MKDSVDPRERAWIATARWTKLRGELLACCDLFRRLVQDELKKTA